MTTTAPAQIQNVSVPLKANVYFEGKVVSHTLLAADGTKKTLGLIYPGTFLFNTDAPERMDIVSGSCRVKIKGQSDWTSYAAGTYFRVPGKSSFEIAMDSGLAEYLCTFE